MLATLHMAFEPRVIKQDNYHKAYFLRFVTSYDFRNTNTDRKTYSGGYYDHVIID